ncbi:hypothetical protein NIES2135_61460 (plasmid) [Leptolyngbya boryana NIES-2135]|jgi:hypothetical protein|uniref:Uncharacterized protein n=1 Tax=Leptolyngbya boryana NIES-2135 TaxID=1973484 RepID=A0A1Z4JRC9_LEPBY|nr:MULTISPECIES: hypothetical protein [Leptolyngbya]BAY59269.1 hypothetical protein NIES2135_61460 [Leptolyngbya boryana NIES-2135]MBD2372857.1 hypothetical protein [Leptolyngbya sp. FACHB-238]MBD2397390.1 hypothetical protein [Leptolyngbya sp. FACHB-239]MBD2403805.1 hypothetical protein [Leptolyngbya sp. FACHB-402]ULP33461.1 hypothetical protein MCP04_30495 [Leptolyngbya boryana IU 594]
MTTNIPTTTFAPITAAWDRQFARLLPDGAQILWKWLRRMAKPGTEIEFELEDFTEEHKYSSKWARHSLNLLVKNGLVEILRQYRGYGFKVKVNQPDAIGNKSSISRNTASDRGEECSDNDHSTSQKPTANGENPSDLNREENRESFKKEQQNTAVPPSHPVLNGQENVFEADRNRQNPTYSRLLNEAERIGVRLNSQLEQEMLAAPAIVLENAIEALKQRLRAGKTKIKNKEGFLRKAIRGGWRPNLEQASGEPASVKQDSRPTRGAIDNHLPARPQPDGPIDLSDILVGIDLALEHLRFESRLVAETLRSRYGVPDQSRLDTDQLMDWHVYLQTFLPKPAS